MNKTQSSLVKNKKKGFYESKKWKNLKRTILRIYGCKCMKCKHVGYVHVDHIKPRSLYPGFEYCPKNLQVLCEDCNLEKSNLNCIDYRTVKQKRKMKQLISKDESLRKNWLESKRKRKKIKRIGGPKISFKKKGYFFHIPENNTKLPFQNTSAPRVVLRKKNKDSVGCEVTS